MFLNPGRRTIYDFASRYNNSFYGFDVKTKDLDSDRYSDGGVCSVANLLKFLANEKAIFVVAEFGHRNAAQYFIAEIGLYKTCSPPSSPRGYLPNREFRKRTSSFK